MDNPSPQNHDLPFLARAALAFWAWVWHTIFAAIAAVLFPDR